MKYLIFLLLLPYVAHSQTQYPLGDKFPMKDGKVFYEYIDTFPQQNKDELFSKVAIWASGVFRNSQEANQLVDSERGEYIAKGSIYDESFIADVRYFFALRVSVKDYKCRIQVYNIESINTVFPNAQPTPVDKGLTSKKLIRRFHDKIGSIAYDLFNSLKQDKKDDDF